MELQFHKDQISCLANAFHDCKNLELTQEIRLTDGMPDIGRILGVWGQPVIRSKEWRTDSVGMSGGVMAWVLYVPEDGTEFRSMETWIPMQMSMDIPDHIPEGVLRILPMIRFADGRSISARKIMLRIGINVLCQALYPMEKFLYQPDKIPEDIQILRNTYPVRLWKEAGERGFTLDEDISVPENMPKPEKILAYTMQPEIHENKLIGSRLLFKGNGNLRVLYRCSAGKLHIHDFELPFSQYADLQTEYGRDAGVDMYIALTNLEVDSRQDRQLYLKCSLIEQYRIDDLQTLEILEDAYSTHRCVELDMAELELPVVLDKKTEILTAEQMIPGVSDPLTSLSFYPDQPRIRSSENGITTEQSALFQGILSGEDHVLQRINARWEGSLNIPVDRNVKVDMTVQAKGFPKSISGLEGTTVTGQVQAQMTFSTDQKFSVVSGMELGDVEEQNPDRPSLILYRPCGERLWDIAKRNGSTVQIIRDANGIDNEAEPGRMLLIPVS